MKIFREVGITILIAVAVFVALQLNELYCGNDQYGT